jgi:hypothetical protein
MEAAQIPQDTPERHRSGDRLLAYKSNSICGEPFIKRISRKFKEKWEAPDLTSTLEWC